MKRNQTYEQWTACGCPPFYWGSELITGTQAENTAGDADRVEQIFDDLEAAQRPAEAIMDACPDSWRADAKRPAALSAIPSNALTLDLNSDTQTQQIYSSKSRTDIRTKIRNSFRKTDELSDVKMTDITALPYLKDPACSYVSITGHGSALSVKGYTKNPVFSCGSPDIAAIAKGKVFFLTTCQTCVPEFGLGVTLVQNKANAVFGYKNNLVIPTDAAVALLYFYPSFFAAETDFLNGNTPAQNALLYGKYVYNDNIKKLGLNTSIPNRVVYVSMLKYDLAILCGPQAGETRFGDPDYKL